MTWIDVADTAVKIALGSVLAAVFGFFTARQAHLREDRARYAQRRRDYIDRILDLLIDVEQTYIMQKGRLDAYRLYKDSDPSEAAKAASEFAELDARFYVDLAKFTRASSVLLMLGEQSADARLGEYRDAVDEWYSHSVLDLSSFPQADFDRLRARIRASREAALAALAAAYRAT